MASAGVSDSMGTLGTAVSDLLSWALSLGPVGAWLLPVAGLALGLLAVGGGYFVAAQRLRRRARDLLVRAKRHVPRGEEGKRVVLVGRLRVAGADAVPSFADGRAVAVSSVSTSQGSVTSVVETRSAPTLALETTEGLVPIEGVIEVDRTRAGRRVRSEEPRSYPPELARALRVTDVCAGERVMVEGRLGRVAREGLREPGAVLGVSSETLRFGQVPVRITALRIEAPRALVPMALAGAIGCALCLTPLSLDVSLWSLAGVRPDYDVSWQLRAAARLLGPTRTSALDEVAVMPALAGSLELGWVRAALQEQGRCYEEALGSAERARCSPAAPTRARVWPT